MELRYLNAFVTLAEERHFGRAAIRLGISQPPLSRQIQQLEAELGVQLFRRNARSVEVTLEGSRYLAAVRPHLEGLARATHATQATARQVHGQMKVGFVSSLGYGLMPRLLDSLHKVAPGIGVELFEGPSAQQCQGVRERRLDLGFVYLPVEAGELKMRWLFQEPLVAMLPARHAFAKLSEVALARLQHEPFILCARQPDDGFHEVVLDLCRAAGFEPQAGHSASSMAAIAELVAAGLGIALVPRSAIGQGHAGVIYKPLTNQPLILEVGAVWWADAMTPALRMLLDQAIKAAQHEKR